MQPTLTGPRVVLRPWRADDVDAVTAACQDPEIQRWTQVPVPYGRQDAEGFVGDIAEATRADGGALFAVVTPEGVLAGSIGLFPPDGGVGEIGYWTVAEQRGRGYTAEAVALLAEWAFAERGLHRVELHVDPANTGSRRVAERAGFHRRGRRPAALPPPGAAGRRRPVLAPGDRPEPGGMSAPEGGPFGTRRG